MQYITTEPSYEPTPSSSNNWTVRLAYVTGSRIEEQCFYGATPNDAFVAASLFICTKLQPKAEPIVFSEPSCV